MKRQMIWRKEDADVDGGQIAVTKAFTIRQRIQQVYASIEHAARKKTSFVAVCLEEKRR